MLPTTDARNNNDTKNRQQRPKNAGIGGNASGPFLRVDEISLPGVVVVGVYKYSILGLTFFIVAAPTPSPCSCPICFPFPTNFCWRGYKCPLVKRWVVPGINRTIATGGCDSTPS